MSDRSSNPSFAVSRNLKNAKYHFIEAKVDKLTESSDIINSDTTQVSSDTWNSVSSSTWLCATSNMKSTSRKTWQTSLLFLEPLQVQNLKRKSGGDMAYYVPQIKKWRGHVPRVPHQIALIPTSRMKRETNDASKSQVNQASWNRLVLKFDSGNQLGIHNYLWIVFFCDFPLIARSGKVTSLSVRLSVRRTPREQVPAVEKCENYWHLNTWKLVLTKKTSFEKLTSCNMS